MIFPAELNDYTWQDDPHTDTFESTTNLVSPLLLTQIPSRTTRDVPLHLGIEFAFGFPSG